MRGWSHPHTAKGQGTLAVLSSHPSPVPAPHPCQPPAGTGSPTRPHQPSVPLGLHFHHTNCPPTFRPPAHRHVQRQCACPGVLPRSPPAPGTGEEAGSSPVGVAGPEGALQHQGCGHQSLLPSVPFEAPLLIDFSWDGDCRAKQAGPARSIMDKVTRLGGRQQTRGPAVPGQLCAVRETEARRGQSLPEVVPWLLIALHAQAGGGWAPLSPERPWASGVFAHFTGEERGLVAGRAYRIPSPTASGH